MRIKGIDFPEQLLNAQREGSLVIFAGAGVSMGHPSNYPSFNGLVEKVAQWAAKKPQEGEPPEHFLGRLVHEKKNVHDQVVKILSSPESKHSPIHENLLKLFTSQEQVRIVTTNFDSHFRSAAVKVFGHMPEVFCAPALPLGSDFSGIVYLHGSVLKDPRKLVLTDQDFGCAYLTEGWATRFLQAMFSQYTVLFIGYSHDDIVMHYLSRGLPPEVTKPRFALIRADKDSVEWKYRGIEPLQYPHEDENDHSQLNLGVTGWVEWASRGALDTERRIKSIVTGPPPLDDEEQDFLQWAVNDTMAVKFFVRYATGTEWLLWANEHKIILPLFAQPDLSQVAKELALWVANNFVIQHADTLFAMLERCNSVLNPWFVCAIIQHLSYINPVPDKDIIFRWVPILLQNNSLVNPLDCTELLERSIEQDALAAAVQLLEYLTRPHIQLKKNILRKKEGIYKSPKADAELNFFVDYSMLSEIWGKN